MKNLHKQVTAEDLVSLFIRFQQPSSSGEKIVFKLMKERAFITFPGTLFALRVYHRSYTNCSSSFPSIFLAIPTDIESAKSALTLVNGYTLRGKPIIIEYGTKSTNSK